MDTLLTAVQYRYPAFCMMLLSVVLCVYVGAYNPRGLQFSVGRQVSTVLCQDMSTILFLACVPRRRAVLRFCSVPLIIFPGGGPGSIL